MPTTFKLPEGFSNELRIWNYVPEKSFTDVQIQHILNAGKAFAKQWQVHGKPLKAEVIVQDAVLISVVVDKSQADASGCSIDKSIAFIQGLEQDLGITLMNRMKFIYALDNQIHIGNYNQAQTLPNNAEVFNHLATDRKSYESTWVPLKESWLAPQFI